MKPRLPFTLSILLLLSIVLLLLLAGHSSTTAQGGGTTTRVSVASNGTQGNWDSHGPSTSADGRYVAFNSRAYNLVPNDTNQMRDIFVHDRIMRQTTRVSVSSTGVQGNLPVEANSAISDDGRYVMFDSYATNLVSGDTNNFRDVFIHDRVTRQTTRISVSNNGVQGNDISAGGALSYDGRYAMFNSRATNLVPGDTNNELDVFLYDQVLHQISRVSVSSDGTQGNGSSGGGDFSADGRYVAFTSNATNFIIGDTNNKADVFVLDRTTGQIDRVSIAYNVVQANDGSEGPTISADGRYVAFWSSATNLVPNDTNGLSDVFVRDRVSNDTMRVSVSSDGIQANDYTFFFDADAPSISANGRYVVFHSSASNLVLGDTNNTDDVFIHDRVTRQTTRVSVSTNNGQSDDPSLSPAVSADGRYVAFTSFASNLVASDTNADPDIFIRDRGVVLPTPTPSPTPTPPKVAVLVHGFQLLGGHQCSDGIQGPYTSASPPSSDEFGNVTTELLAQGYTVYFARWDAAWLLAGRLDDAAECLKNQLVVADTRTPFTQAILIAHSMGGLVSRAYLEDESLYQGNVSRLITFGTPHLGVADSALMNILILTGGQCGNVCQLTTTAMQAFNDEHQPSGQIPYYLLGGTAYQDFYQTLLRHDGIINLYSAVGSAPSDVPWWLRPVFPFRGNITASGLTRWQSDAAHHSFFTLMPGAEYHYFDDPATVPCLRRFLGGTAGGSCTPFDNATTVSSTSPLAYLPRTSGTLGGGTSQSYTIPLEGSASDLYLAWTEGAVSFTLRTPSGVAITPATVGQVGGSYEERADSDWYHLAHYHLANPEVGTWQLVITPAAATTTSFVTWGASDSQITFSAALPPTAAPGASISIRATLMNGTAPISSSNVVAQLLGPGGSSVTLASQGNGEYQGFFQVPPMPGTYYFLVRATGTSDGVGFAREQVLSLAVLSPDVVLNGAATEQPVDANVNGRYEALDVTVPLQTVQAGTYSLMLTLRTADDRFVTEVRREMLLNVGTTTVTLQVPGSLIRSSALNGPYLVDLRAVSHERGEIVLNQIPLLQTRIYQASQFENASLYLPLIAR